MACAHLQAKVTISGTRDKDKGLLSVNAVFSCDKCGVPMHLGDLNVLVHGMEIDIDGSILQIEIDERALMPSPCDRRY